MIHTLRVDSQRVRPEEQDRSEAEIAPWGEDPSVSDFGFDYSIDG